MPNAYGYVRVSTLSQNFDVQVDQIKTYCKMRDYNLLRIFDDKATGKNMDRPGYQDLLGALDKNPQNITIVIVTKLDRVGRSLKGLIEFVEMCSAKNISFVAIGNSIDTTTNEGLLFFHMMGALAQYERTLILERTAAGREKYLAEGGKLGREKIKLPVDEIKRLVGEGVPKREVARRMRISVPTVYDRLQEGNK